MGSRKDSTEVTPGLLTASATQTWRRQASKGMPLRSGRTRLRVRGIVTGECRPLGDLDTRLARFNVKESGREVVDTHRLVLLDFGPVRPIRALDDCVKGTLKLLVQFGGRRTLERTEANRKGYVCNDS